MKKSKSLRTRIKSWIFETFLQRYLVSVDAMFINLFIKFDKKAPPVVYVSRAEVEYKRIMKTLNSPKFKEYFYKVVKYDRHAAQSLIKPYGKTMKDKIFSFIAETYIRFFNRELYQNILQFKRVRDGIITLNEKIDEYMANTTIEERLDKAASIGIIPSDNRVAQRRLRNMQAIGVTKIKERNKL